MSTNSNVSLIADCDAAREVGNEWHGADQRCEFTERPGANWNFSQAIRPTIANAGDNQHVGDFIVLSSASEGKDRFHPRFINHLLGAVCRSRRLPVGQLVHADQRLLLTTNDEMVAIYEE